MKFSNLPLETYYHIGVNMSYKELLKSCSVSKNFAALCANPLFWKYKSMNDFKISSETYDEILAETHDDREVYIQLAGLRNIPILGAERYGYIEKLIKNALAAGEYELFGRFLRLYPTFNITNILGRYGLKQIIDRCYIRDTPEQNCYALAPILNGAIEGGHYDLIKYLLDKGACITAPMIYSVYKSGNSALGQSLLDMIPEHQRHDAINLIMHDAALDGNLDIINYALSRGADDYNTSLTAAAESGNQTIIDMMIKLGANDFNMGLMGAAKGGHIDIVQQMINHGGDDVNLALSAAVESNNIELIRYLIDNGADEFNDVLSRAVAVSNLEIIKYIINRGNLNNHTTDFIPLIEHAVHRGDLNIVKYLLTYAVVVDYNLCLFIAAKNGHLHIAKFLVQQGATDLLDAKNVAQPNVKYYLDNLIFNRLGQNYNVV